MSTREGGVLGGGGGKRAEITGAWQQSGSRPGAPLCYKSFVFLCRIIICRLCELTLLDQAQVTLQLRVNLADLTLRLLMSYIYIYIYMEHPFLMFLDHTQRRSTVGRTPLDE